MTSGDADSTLNHFFAGLSEHVFHTQLGVVDTQLIDYISELLVRFNRIDNMEKVRQIDGRPATEVVSMVAEAEKRLGEARREVHRHVGDFTLFWSGVYPEALRSMQSRDKKDQFVSYCSQGKRAYKIASVIQADKKAIPGDLLNRISEQFEMCAYGLREIRREWERRDEDGPREIPLIL